jgi:hypothetical protein
MTATTTLNAATLPASSIVTAPQSTVGPHVGRTGLAAGLAAAVATSAFAAIADALGVSLKVGGEAIPAIGFGQVTLVAALIGTVLAVVLSRRANRPQHTFVVTTIALTCVTFVPDVLADAPNGTRLALALSHVVAAAIVIPALASRLAD